MNTIGSAGLIARAGAGRVRKQTRLPPAWVDGGDGSYVTRTPSREGSALRVNLPDAAVLDEREGVRVDLGAPGLQHVGAPGGHPAAVLRDDRGARPAVLAPEVLVTRRGLVLARLEVLRQQVPRLRNV